MCNGVAVMSVAGKENSCLVSEKTQEEGSKNTLALNILYVGPLTIIVSFTIALMHVYIL